MARLLGIVIPLALGAAVSPTTLAVQLVTLSRKTAPVRRSWALAGGFAAVLAGFAVVAVGLARSTGGSSSPSVAGAVVKLVAAVLLVALAVHELRAPPKPPKPEHAGAHPIRAAVALGAGLMLTNFSSIVLFFPAVHEIGISGVPVIDKVVAFVILYAITMLPAIGPPLFVTLIGPRATPMLERLNRFFADHHRGIASGLCVVFAILLTVAGLRALL